MGLEAGGPPGGLWALKAPAISWRPLEAHLRWAHPPFSSEKTMFLRWELRA